MMIMASIPSPSEGVIHLGPLPLRGYAFSIALGIVVAVVLGERRLRARGAPEGTAIDLAVPAVVLGIIGARIYHLITSPDAYFGKNGHPVEALYIWRGGLGIWGAIAGGVLGAWLYLRRRRIPLSIAADALAPTLPLAQAFGRWGNWFNQELYGRPSGLPWALKIDPAHRLPGYENTATYQPTFLYESLWCLGVALLCLWADKRFRLGGGRVFALYVAAYTAGRGWIESLRIDTAHRFFGLRLNDYVSIVVFLVAVGYLIARRGARDVAFHPLGPERVSLTKPADTAKEAKDVSESAAAQPATVAGGEADESRTPADSESARGET
jgi:prolipoprotein diacylglyceryl transferase